MEEEEETPFEAVLTEDDDDEEDGADDGRAVEHDAEVVAHHRQVGVVAHDLSRQEEAQGHADLEHTHGVRSVG